MFGLFSKQEKKFKKYLTSLVGDSTWSLGVASVTIRHAKKWGISPDVLMHETQQAMEIFEGKDHLPNLKDIAHDSAQVDGYFKSVYSDALVNIMGYEEFVNRYPRGPFSKF